MFACMRILKCTNVQLQYAVILFTLVLLGACNGCKNKTQTVIKPNEQVTVKLMRFENELFAINPQSPQAGLAQLNRKYGNFYTSYARDILRMPMDPNDTLFVRPMQMLLSYKPLMELHRTVDSMFKDMSDIEAQLSEAMSIYKAAFPSENIPSFITFLSEFGYANVTYDSAICIGLDMYMNKRYLDYYRAYEFPEFMIRKLEPAYIVPNAIKAIAIRNYEQQTSKDKRFLAMMIQEGKVRYFTKALLPNVHDSLIMGYTASQLKWSEENEAQMWTHFIEKNMLFKNEPTEYMRYFNDGPFTSADGVPPESSPMIGTWAGLQLIRKYMDENPTVTLKQLMEETDVDKILKLSKYRPQ